MATGSIQLPPLRQRRFEIGMPMPVHLDKLDQREMIWEEQLADLEKMKKQANSRLSMLRSSSAPGLKIPAHIQEQKLQKVSVVAFGVSCKTYHYLSPVLILYYSCPCAVQGLIGLCEGAASFLHKPAK